MVGNIGNRKVFNHNNSNNRMKSMTNYLFLFLLVMALSSFASAEILPQEQNVNYTLLFSADNASSCNFTYIQYSDKSLSPFYNLAMNKNGQMFNIFIGEGNFTKLGITCMFYSCFDASATPQFASGNTCVNVTPNGTILTSVHISIYIFFLLICLVITYLSFKITRDNSMQKDELDESQMYQLKKRNEVKFYLELMKKKLWIVGLFGIYLSLLLAVVILNQLVYNLGLGELNEILISIAQIMLWGSIPFVLFWFVYILIYFFKSTTVIMRWQLGRFRA